MNVKTLIRSRLSIGAQALATFCGIVLAVLLPQVFHLLGAALGKGTGLGEMFLPMHLPVMLVGLIAGPYIGGAVGLLSPLVSFWMTGMPGAKMLPFMMIELCVYGIAMGVFSNMKGNIFLKVLGAQVLGRAARAVAILLTVYAFHGQANVASIWTSIPTGWPGLLIQWAALIALGIYLRKKYE